MTSTERGRADTKASRRRSRIIAGLLALALLTFTAVWIARDAPPTSAPALAEPAGTRRAKPMALEESTERPAPRPIGVPQAPSAVPTALEGARDLAASRVYELRHASGAAATGLRVAFRRAGRTVHVGESDEQGRLVFADRDPEAGPPAGLWIGGVSGLIQGTPNPEPDPDGVSRVILPRGNELAGSVTVDGRVPGRPVDLALHRFGAREHQLPPDEKVRERLARPETRMASHRAYEAANAQRVTADGSFRFSGLDDGWRGRLYFPSDLHLDPLEHAEQHTPAGGAAPDGLEGLTSLELEWVDGQLPTPLRLSLRTMPDLRGRAIWPDGTPAAGVAVSYTFVDEPHGFTIRCEPTAADGRFAIPCSWRRGKHPRLTFLAPDGIGMASLAVREAHRTRGMELGDVRLERTRAVVFRALDVSGEPVAGAIATPSDASDTRSPRTDADGLSRIALSPGAPRFTVHALEHDSTDVPVPEEIPDVLDVVMERCCVLRLRLADGSGSAASLLMWRISSRAMIFTRDDDIRPEPIRHELGLPSPRRSSFQRTAGVGSGTVSFAVEPDGLVLSCLRPNTLLDVSLTDRSGNQVVWEERSLSLAPGEDRLVVARVDTRVRRFAGRVTDPQGAPIEAARLYVGPAGGPVPSLGADTDADGRFEVDGLLCDAVDFDCSMPGYLTVEQTDVPVAPGEDVRIVLRPSRLLDVEITSTSRLSPDATLSVMVQGSSVFSAGLRRTTAGGGDTGRHGYSATVEAALGEEATLRLEDGGRTEERISAPDERAILWELP